MSTLRTIAAVALVFAVMACDASANIRPGAVRKQAVDCKDLANAYFEKPHENVLRTCARQIFGTPSQRTLNKVIDGLGYVKSSNPEHLPLFVILDESKEFFSEDFARNIVNITDQLPSNSGRPESDAVHGFPGLGYEYFLPQRGYFKFQDPLVGRSGKALVLFGYWMEQLFNLAYARQEKVKVEAIRFFFEPEGFGDDKQFHQHERPVQSTMAFGEQNDGTIFKKGNTERQAKRREATFFAGSKRGGTKKWAAWHRGEENETWRMLFHVTYMWSLACPP